MSDRSFIILVKNAHEGKQVIKLLNSNLYIFMLMLIVLEYRTSQAPQHYRTLPKIDIPLRMSDNEICKIFKLTKSEIKLIEEFI